MKVVVMAGGKGTRIASINSEVPKPMIEILGKPILEHQVNFFKKNGLTDMIFVVGYLKDSIVDYFKDGKKFGVNIQYVVENEPLDTAGSFYYLKDMIKNEDFILVNGDIIFDVNIQKAIDFHNHHKADVTLFTHPNSHPFDSSLIITDENNRVIKWLSKEDERLYYRNRVNSGIHILSHKILDLVNEPVRVNFDRDILKKNLNTLNIFAYDTPEYIKDMGTPERYYQVVHDMETGKIAAKNLENKQKAIFLDRDGTINKYVGFLRNIDDFELIDGTIEGIKLINESGYLAIVVTNQPVIARGEVTIEELDLIHQKLETLLGKGGAYIDSIYYCPHHPDKGFEGEVPELKIDCACRKPKTGLVDKAVKDFNIDLSKSYMIGDSDNDKHLADNLNIPYYEVNENKNIEDVVKEILKNENN